MNDKLSKLIREYAKVAGLDKAGAKQLKNQIKKNVDNKFSKDLVIQIKKELNGLIAKSHINDKKEV